MNTSDSRQPMKNLNIYWISCFTVLSSHTFLQAQNGWKQKVIPSTHALSMSLDKSEASSALVQLDGQKEAVEWNWGAYGDSTFIPISVWLQNVDDIPLYKNAGFNTYMGFWGGITESELAKLREEGMHYIVGWNKSGFEDQPDLLARDQIDDPLFLAWTHRDEPDNAQPLGGAYGPCIDPHLVIDSYKEIIDFDTTGRPVLLNCGAGVARTDAHLRGSCAGNTDSYVQYYQGADIASFDIYPVSSPPAPVSTNDDLWYVWQGVRNMKTWTDDKKPLWFFLECTDIKGEGKATPEQIRVEAWMGIIAGGTGIGWFPYSITPSFDDRALLKDQVTLNAVTEVNREIHDFAPIINAATVSEVVDRKLNDFLGIGVEFIAKQWNDTLYIFASGMRNWGSNTATFNIKSSTEISSDVIVIGEDRQIELRDNSFVDEFDGYAIHLYKIGGIGEGLLTSVSEKQLRPESGIRLQQNYPNPFEHRTSITYELTKSMAIELTVYNLFGQKIAILDEGVQKAGSRTASFDASKLTTGVYFYQLRSGAFVLSKKFIVR